MDRRYSGGGVVDSTRLAQLADEVSELFTVDGEWDGGPGLGKAVGRPAIADRLRTPDADLLTSSLRQTEDRRGWGSGYGPVGPALPVP